MAEPLPQLRRLRMAQALMDKPKPVPSQPYPQAATSGLQSYLPPFEQPGNSLPGMDYYMPQQAPPVTVSAPRPPARSMGVAPPPAGLVQDPSLYPDIGSLIEQKGLLSKYPSIDALLQSIQQEQMPRRWVEPWQAP